jgi:hemin uptake protein HemP
MPSTHIEESPSAIPARPDPASPDRVVTTRELLGNSHRIWIEHATQRYLLQVTRSGKLILTK